MSALWARNSCGWSPEMLDRRSAARRSSVSAEAVRVDVEVVGVLVVEARGHVLPEVAQGGRQLLLGGDHHERLVGHQVEQLPEAVDRQHVGDVGALGGLGRWRRSRPARGARARARRRARSPRARPPRASAG